MSQPSTIGSFFGGGGKSFSWKDKPLGTTITGTIKAVHPPQPQTDPATQEIVINKRTGQPKMQVRIELATSERDPADPEDDGTRNLYVGGWMQGAVGDALRKAGRQEPEVGGQLTVQLTEREPNSTPGLNPINKFAAGYVPAPVTGQFFNGQPGAAQQVATALGPHGSPQMPNSAMGYQPQAAPVPGSPAYQPPASGLAQPVAQYQPPAPPAPVKPPSIAQASWELMDPGTQAAVAATMLTNSPGEPPF